MPVASTAGVFDLVILQREQVAQLSGAHTHTHTHISARTHTCKERQRKEALNERWQTTSLLGVGSGFLLDSSGREMPPLCLLYVQVDQTKSLLRNLWEAQAVGKECPPLTCGLSASVLISHRSGLVSWGPPRPGGRAGTHSLLTSLGSIKSIS